MPTKTKCCKESSKAIRSYVTKTIGAPPDSPLWLTVRKWCKLTKPNARCAMASALTVYGSAIAATQTAAQANKLRTRLSQRAEAAADARLQEEHHKYEAVIATMERGLAIPADDRDRAAADNWKAIKGVHFGGSLLQTLFAGNLEIGQGQEYAAWMIAQCTWKGRYSHDIVIEGQKFVRQKTFYRLWGYDPLNELLVGRDEEKSPRGIQVGAHERLELINKDRLMEKVGARINASFADSNPLTAVQARSPWIRVRR